MIPQYLNKLHLLCLASCEMFDKCTLSSILKKKWVFFLTLIMLWWNLISVTLLVGKCLTNGALNTLMIWLRSLIYWVSSKMKSLTMSSYDWASVLKPMGSSTRGSETSSSEENMSINTCKTGSEYTIKTPIVNSLDF